MKKFLLLCFILFTICIPANSENIHFNNNIYKIKNIENNDNNTENEYFIENENSELWTSYVEIKYYPEISNPLKFAAENEKKISSEKDSLLLKFVQNKKSDIAVLSYLENEIKDDCACFIYYVLKYEKHPDKGIMTLKFAKKYPVHNNEDIKNIATEIKTINNDYMERIIISPIPPIIKNNSN